MKKKICLLLMIITAGVYSFAQEEKIDTLQMLEQRTADLEDAVNKLKGFKVSGYIQGQYQYGEKETLSLKVGDKFHQKDEGYNRIGIRRGRIKFAYEKDIYMGVFQLDITEKGVGVKDVYFQVKDPWLKSNTLKLGVFDRPFGYEISYSSSLRESPERSTVFQTLFPDERDLGAMLVLQAPKTSPWSILKLEGGLFAGNGIKIDNDNHKDFIGHLSASRHIGSIGNWGVGFSYYNGRVTNPTEVLYSMNGSEFKLDSVEQYSLVKREYFGIDGRIAIESVFGMTQFRGEYLWGTQPGSAFSPKSPNHNSTTEYLAFLLTKSGNVSISGLYERNFMGYYITLVQDLGRTPFTVVLKYDVYDPNTEIKGDEINAGGSNSSFADLEVSTFGFGAIWRCSQNLKLTAYYEINNNEKAPNATASHSDLYNHERKDNVFTLRLQYKF